MILSDDHCLPGLTLETDGLVSTTKDWIVPIALTEAMSDGRPLSVCGAISARMESNIEAIQDIYCSWMPELRRVAVSASGHASYQYARGVSAFFSGGVDSFYSLLKHQREIDTLIVVHGFDIPVEDIASFERAREAAVEIASIFAKRLITVKTNLRKVCKAISWNMQHGAALATVAHALQPCHAIAYVGSTYAYYQLHPWGSHPALDPLWSSEAVQMTHDGAEADRIGKTRLICEHPELIKHLRVCWQNTGDYNCGLCEKCLRTMVALRGLGALQLGTFAVPDIDPVRIKQLQLDDQSVPYWRELLALDLPRQILSAIEHALRNFRWDLPPRGSLTTSQRRRTALRQLIDFSKALFLP